MTRHRTPLSRRDFLKLTGVISASAMLPACASATSGVVKPASRTGATVPVRAFGKTGVRVSMLALGGSSNLLSRQRLLRQALKMGVTYWDTAESYAGGRSEEGIGRYFKTYPEDRHKVFLVTKSDAGRPARLTKSLHRSLERMHTAHIDLFFLHGIRGTDELDQEVRQWAKKMKAQGKIRWFGFSTHSNMEACLSGAARLGWIDGIMFTYNYRLMHTDRMKAAVDACVQAGIGLTAMKTQAGWSWGTVGREGKTAKRMKESFQQQGFTEEQAKLKAVWENPHIASICSHMPNLDILAANAAAALDRVALSRDDRLLLEQHARETAPVYCAGCARLCETAFDRPLPVQTAMRSLMYGRSYHDPERARSVFSTIPLSVAVRMAETDYTVAERRCPQGMPIGRLMHEALTAYA